MNNIVIHAIMLHYNLLFLLLVPALNIKMVVSCHNELPTTRECVKLLHWTHNTRHSFSTAADACLLVVSLDAAVSPRQLLSLQLLEQRGPEFSAVDALARKVNVLGKSGASNLGVTPICPSPCAMPSLLPLSIPPWLVRTS